MKKILGLDLGVSSIGWSVISVDENGDPVVLPADAALRSSWAGYSARSDTAWRLWEIICWSADPAAEVFPKRA